LYQPTDANTFRRCVAKETQKSEPEDVNVADCHLGNYAA